MSLTAGSRLGTYEITAILGAGGMGEVYRARDSKLQRDVAVKVLPAAVATDPDRLARFQQEARAAGALNHPNLITIYELGVDGGLPYLVMELLEGETLRDRLRGGARRSPSGGTSASPPGSDPRAPTGSGPALAEEGRALPVRKSVDYAIQLARGLAAAHDRGIVHRDLKPENVFVTRDGRIKILDFGLAKLAAPVALDGDLLTAMAGATAPGTVLGTAGYMAPEQVRGEAADHRADLFALGAILYEMLSGRRAFHGETPVETMNAILKDDPPELAAQIRDLTPDLARTVQHCLEKQPDERFQSALDLAFALTAVGGASGEDRVAGALPAPRRWAKSAAWLLAVGALGALVGAGLFSLRARPADSPPVRLQVLTYSGSDSEPAASPDGRTIAFSSRRNGRLQIWLKQLADGTETARTAGPSDLSPRFSPDGATLLFLRGTENRTADLYRTPVLGGEERRLLDDVISADWSPDGREIAGTSRNGRIRILPASGGTPREIARLADLIPTRVRWSPDGRWLVFGVQPPTGLGASSIQLLSIDGRERRTLEHSTLPSRSSGLAWVGAGDALVYAAPEPVGRARRVILHDIRTGTTRPLFWTLSSPTREVLRSSLDVLAPGTLVLDAVTERQNLRSVPLGAAAGSIPSDAWLTRGSSIDRQPSFSPDSRRVVFTSDRSGSPDLWSLSLDDGTLRRVTDDPGGDMDPAYSPDGASIVWSSNRSGHFEIWMAAADGVGARQVSQDGQDAENPTMTPDGRWIVYASGSSEKRGIWKVRPDGSGAAALARGQLTLPETSPDGRYVAFVIPSHSPSVVRIGFVELESATSVPFSIDIPRALPAPNLGRFRWMPGGRAIAFYSADAQGVSGVFVQDFAPGRDTTASRRKLAGFFADAPIESFGVAPDGSSVVVSGLETQAELLLAENVPGVTPARRGP